ncbi:NYN domain-containing protein [Acidovorax sp. HDW3]|uniref:NYN domain-containing protein n=1 Tax=Acidovorax sp. HDW3 TaxID=2714923 RepID=UPI001F10C5E8|nr:NYN domain-containing protein [Acidovorax sp. HDW3]
MRNLAVFIDADNLSDATALDHVLNDLRQRADRVLYKRAYGRAESLKAIEAVLWRHGVRPVANMIVNKVTTDSALVIDAVEAVCQNQLDAVAICSGDADFVPLATWLREKGCLVWCFSLAGQIFANPESFYDDVVLLELVEPPSTATAVLEDSTAATAPAQASIGVPEATPQPPMPLAPKSHAVAPAPVTPAVCGGNVEQILCAYPALRTGMPQHLGQVIKALREQGILAAGTKATTWFAQWGAAFVLSPFPAPNQIMYQAAATKSRCPALPDDVARTLAAIPALREVPQQLSHIVPVLREHTILGKTTKSTAFFARYPAYFRLSPAQQPTQVAYTAPAPLSVADVLLAVPEMLAGQWMDLGSVSKKLHTKGLVRTPEQVRTLLAAHPARFLLIPPGAPNAVQYLR